MKISFDPANFEMSKICQGIFSKYSVPKLDVFFSQGIKVNFKFKAPL